MPIYHLSNVASILIIFRAIWMPALSTMHVCVMSCSCWTTTSQRNHDNVHHINFSIISSIAVSSLAVSPLVTRVICTTSQKTKYEVNTFQPVPIRYMWCDVRLPCSLIIWLMLKSVECVYIICLVPNPLCHNANALVCKTPQMTGWRGQPVS